jgi:hypothetical protein
MIGIFVVAALAASPAAMPPRCSDHSHLASRQIGGQHGEAIVVTLCPSEFNRYVPALDIAGFEHVKACS